jgi:hypothetical protein
VPASRAFRAALALLLLGLAGCGGKGGDGGAPPGPEGPGPDGAEAREDGWPLPEWRVGDAWTYSVQGEPTTYGITSETATDWIMDTDSEERAFQDARQDISRLGPQRKSDLAGSQGEDRVEFFRWPLAGNRTWTTRWDQQEVSVAVTAVTGDGAALEARTANGTLVYRYTYDARAGWFGELRRFAPNGTEVIALTLDHAIRGWAGPAVRYTVVPLASDAGSDPFHASGKNLDTDPAATDLYLDYRLECAGNGGFSVSLQPADPALATGLTTVGYIVSGPCSGFRGDSTVVPGPPGAAWVLAYDWGGENVEWSLDVWQRTRTEVPVTA